MSKNAPQSLRIRCEAVLNDLATDREVVDLELLEVLEVLLPETVLQSHVYNSLRANELREQAAQADTAQMQLDAAESELAKATAAREELTQANAAIGQVLATPADLSPDKLREQIAARNANSAKLAEIETLIEQLATACRKHSLALRRCEDAQDALSTGDLAGPFVRNSLRKVDAERAELTAQIRKLSDRIEACRAVLTIDPADEIDRSGVVFKAFFDADAANKNAEHKRVWAIASSVFDSISPGFQEASVLTIDRTSLEGVQSSVIDVMQPLVEAESRLAAELAALDDRRTAILSKG